MEKVQNVGTKSAITPIKIFKKKKKQKTKTKLKPTGILEGQKKKRKSAPH